jgi:hypothetical protein
MRISGNRIVLRLGDTGGFRAQLLNVQFDDLFEIYNSK